MVAVQSPTLPSGGPLRAVIWDYDGTLVDTRLKNLNVTRALMLAISGRPLEDFPALRSLEAYVAADRRVANWRELDSQEFGLSDEQVEEAGRLWTTYQMRDNTPIALFDGVAETVRQLSPMPQAIFSQNGRAPIRQALQAAGLDHHFSVIIGHEQVSTAGQKPAPDGLLACLKQMDLASGQVFFVGDHPTDILCARRANAALSTQGSKLRIIAVAAEFEPAPADVAWPQPPDHIIRHPLDVVALSTRNAPQG